MTSVFFKRDIAHGFSRMDGYRRENVYRVYDLLHTVKINDSDIKQLGRKVCRAGDLSCVKYLISVGFCSFGDGLVAAAQGGHCEIIELLIQHGATTLDIGMFVAWFSGKLDAVELLIRRGAAYMDGLLPLACQGGAIGLVNLAINSGATYCHACKK